MAVTTNWPRVTCAALLLAAVAACDTKAPYEPSLPPAAGFRVDNGVLKLWTGTPCAGVTGVRLIFDSGTSKSTEQVWTAPRPGVPLEHLDLVRPTADGPLQVTKPLPANYDWTKADSLVFSIDGPQAHGARVSVSQILTESAQHPPETYLFGKTGWLDAPAVARENQKSFLTICTPDPG
ncbi:hypothetical protein [Actinokineospora diospyrosa]|uniref:Uncharacterized protein n=1 Tax=Actinokineospora diospyrosa TaxID=103728 RepID=A0ABT1IK63_9PSEU|nr:hypothetical protein [Actinokineospora diospyrosa]MCP2273047.1 hypothetical protein [Actinokineospora diospyrosa]